MNSTVYYLLPTSFHLQQSPFVPRYLVSAIWHVSLPEWWADGGEPNHHFLSCTFLSLHALPSYQPEIIYSGLSLDS